MQKWQQNQMCKRALHDQKEWGHDSQHNDAYNNGTYPCKMYHFDTSHFSKKLLWKTAVMLVSHLLSVIRVNVVSLNDMAPGREKKKKSFRRNLKSWSNETFLLRNRIPITSETTRKNFNRKDFEELRNVFNDPFSFIF